MAKYYGSNCIGDCGGHKAGAKYFRNSGRTLTYSSSSFNKGMRVAQKQAKKRGVKSRLQTRPGVSK